MAIVEEIANGHSATHLRNPDGLTNRFTDVRERSVVLVQKKQFGLAIPCVAMSAVNLWIDMSIDDECVGPPAVCKIHKRISPADVSARSLRDARTIRNVGELHVAIIAVESS